MKRIISLILVCVMALGLLASCKPAGQKEQLPEKQRLENVYLTTEHPLPEGIRGTQFISSGDNVYLLCSREELTTDDEGNEVYDFSRILYATDKEFSEYKEVCVLKNENNWSEEETTSTGISVHNAYPTGDGDVIIVYNKWYEDWSDPDEYIYEQSWSLERIAPDGTVLSETDLDFSSLDIDWIYVSDILLMENGKYLVMTDMDAYIMTAEGKLEKKCDAVENLAGMHQLNDGRLIFIYYDEEWNYATGEYDLSSGIFTKYASLGGGNVGSPVVTPEGKLYMATQTELVEYNIETGEKIGTEINWLNSDINPNYVYNIAYLDGYFYNIDQSDWEKPKLMKLTPCDDVIEKYIIDLACIYLDYNMTEKIIKFNRANEDYRVVVTTYNDIDDDGNQLGSTAIDNEIIKGNIPDIISLDQLDFKKYASKGVLTDLGALIDADEDISREDFLPNILEFGSLNGKLYSLIGDFSVETVIGKKSVVGDRFSWTWADLMDTLARYPDSVAFAEMERENMLRSIMRVCLYDFIDYSTGMTSFDSEEFRAILEFCKPYPATIDWDEYYKDYDWELQRQGYRDNKILLQTKYYGSFWDLTYEGDNPFEEETSNIGYPTTSTTSSGSVVYPNSEWAIAEASPFKEQAFDFLKSLFDEENEDVYAFSSNKKLFEKGLAEVVGEEIYDDDAVDMPVVDVMPLEETAEDSVIFDDSMIGGSMIRPVEENKVTQEDADRFYEFVTSVSRRQAPYDHEVINIVVEESASYFDGVKSLDETCKIIQSRAFLYITENM